MQQVVCLLIDDDSEESEIFQYALEELKLPIDCHLATSGRQALDLLKNGRIRPDFIFLDLNMPRMDGKECLKEIKKMDNASQTNVILYSTFFHDEQIKALEALGADGFITKTTSIFELNAELSRVFQTQSVNGEEVKENAGYLTTFDVPNLGLAAN